MSRKSTTIVSTATIRQAFQSGALDPSKVTVTKGDTEVPVSTASLFGKNGTAENPGTVRGRIHPAFVAAFEAANPGMKFGEGENKPADRTVEVPRTGANGRALKPVTLPVAEAKRLAGVSGKRGRLSSAELAAAGVAYQAAQAK